MNIEQARFNMVEQQIRTWEVLDPEILELLFEVKREEFVPSEHRSLAFADLEIPLGHGETMMQPKVEARILQEVAIQPHENVYEVGTGSGYLTALLARRARLQRRRRLLDRRLGRRIRGLHRRGRRGGGGVLGGRRLRAAGDEQSDARESRGDEKRESGARPQRYWDCGREGRRPRRRSSRSTT